MSKKPINENMLRAMRGAARMARAARAASQARNAQTAAEEEGERRYVGRLARQVKSKVDQRNATNDALDRGEIVKRPRLPWKKGGFRGMMNDMIKGHPGYMKKEDVEINEISSDSARRYIRKAKKSSDAMFRNVMDNEKPTEQAKTYDKMMKRSSWIGRARNKHGIKHWEESVDLDEISSAMYGRYINKAEADVEQKTHNFVHKSSKWDKKLLTKISKRSGLIGKAEERKKTVDKGEQKYWLAKRPKGRYE